METLADKYQVYVLCEDDGTGHSIIDGLPLLTFEQWLNR